MDIFNYLKTIYQSKISIYNHVTLFSLLGIMTISLNSYLAFLFGNLFGDFLGFAPSTQFEIFLNLFVGLSIMCFSVGYYYKYINNMFNNNYALPELTLSAYIVFFRCIPLFFVWFFYLLVLSCIGFLLLPFNTFLFHLFFTIILCLIPFIGLVFISFSKDYKYRADLFNPFIILWILDKSLGSVIFLTCKIIILAILPVLGIYTLFNYAAVVGDVMYKLGLRLLGICISVYCFTVLSYIYTMGLVKISKEKLTQL